MITDIEMDKVSLYMYSKLNVLWLQILKWIRYPLYMYSKQIRVVITDIEIDKVALYVYSKLYVL